MHTRQSIWPSETVSPVDQIERLLVVVDSGLLERPVLDDVLIERAIWLARGTGSSIELFHVRDDEPRLSRWLASRQAQAEERVESADSAATRLAELAVDIAAESGLTVDHDARWSKDPAAAIIQKAAECRADIVLKSSERAGYVVGLLEHLDWTLIRQSPAHVWFVGEDEREPRHLLAAIGADGSQRNPGAPDETDQQVCGLASLLKKTLLVQNSLLQVNHTATAAPDNQKGLAALVESTSLDPVTTNCVDSPPREAIPTFAKALEADLIVMGASSLTRLDRLLRPITEEPVLAKTTCDVVFLRPSTPADPPLPAEHTVLGLPAVDVWKALTDPDIVFDHSPQKLAEEDRLSVAMRRRLLRVWEQDLEATLVSEDEGGTTGISPAHLIPAIQRARTTLESRQQSREIHHE